MIVNKLVSKLEAVTIYSNGDVSADAFLNNRCVKQIHLCIKYNDKFILMRKISSQKHIWENYYKVLQETFELADEEKHQFTIYTEKWMFEKLVFIPNIRTIFEQFEVYVNSIKLAMELNPNLSVEI